MDLREESHRGWSSGLGGFRFLSRIRQSDRCVELSCGYRGPILPLSGGLRKVWQPKGQDRCEAELERANATSEPDWEAVAMKRIRRMLRRRHSVLFDALIAIASAMETVVLDFMHPLRPGRHCLAEGRQARLDEAGRVTNGSGRTPEHGPLHNGRTERKRIDSYGLETANMRVG